MINSNLRTATKVDFYVGSRIIDSEGNEFCLRRKYDEGIWECNGRVHFELEAKFYKVKSN